MKDASDLTAIRSAPAGNPYDGTRELPPVVVTTEKPSVSPLAGNGWCTAPDTHGVSNGADAVLARNLITKRYGLPECECAVEATGGVDPPANTENINRLTTLSKTAEHTVIGKLTTDTVSVRVDALVPTV